MLWENMRLGERAGNGRDLRPYEDDRFQSAARVPILPYLAGPMLQRLTRQFSDENVGFTLSSLKIGLSAISRLKPTNWRAALRQIPAISHLG